MTENVIITGIDSRIPKWASEATLKSIHQELTKLNKGSGGKSSSSTGKNIDKENEKQFKFLKDKNASDQKNQKTVQKIYDEFAKNGIKVGDATEDLERSLAVGASSFMKSSASSGLLGSALGKLTGPIGLATSVFGLLASGAISLYKYFEESYEAYQGVYDTGISFQKGMFDLRLAATEAAMPLNEFAKLLTDNSAVVVSLGQDGGRTLGQLSQQTRRLVYDQMKLSVAYTDVNEYLGSYLDTLRLQGFLESITNDERAKGAAEYISQLTLYSQVLGKSRKQIDDEVRKAAARPDVYASLQSLGPKQAEIASKNFRQATAGFAGALGDKSAEFSNVLNSLIVSLNPYETSEIKALIASGNQSVATQMIDFANNIKNTNMTTDQVNSGIVGVIESFRNANIGNIDMLIKSRSQFQEGATSLSGFIQIMKSINKDALQQVRVNKPKLGDDVTTTIQWLGELFRDIRGKYENIFATFIQKNAGSLEKIALAIGDAASQFTTILNDILGNVSKLFDEKTRDTAIADLVSTLSTTMDKFITKVLDVVFEYVRQKIDPTYRSTQQALAQKQSLALAEKKFNALPKTPENAKAKEAFVKGLSDTGFVNKQTSWTGLGAQIELDKMIAAAKAANVDIEEILKPILDSDKDFRDSFHRAQKLTLPPLPGQEQATVKQKQEQEPVTLPASLRVKNSFISSINTQKSQVSSDSTSASDISSNNPSPQNNTVKDLLNKLNNYMETLVSHTQDSKDSLNSIASSGDKSSKSIIEVNRSIRSSSNLIR